MRIDVTMHRLLAKSRANLGRTTRRRSFLHDGRGSAALEFALLGLPFLFLIFAVVELGLVFVMSTSLSNATTLVARQIRVGSVVAGGVATTTSSGTQLDPTDFKAAVCANITLLPTSVCKSQLQVDVRVMGSFATQSSPAPLSGGQFNTSNLCFYSGQSGSIVEVTGYYLWPVITPVILNALVNTTSITGGTGSSTGNWIAITSTEVFKNEPNANINNASGSC